MGKVCNRNVVFPGKVVSYNHNRSSTSLYYCLRIFVDWQVHEFKLVGVEGQGDTC